MQDTHEDMIRCDDGTCVYYIPRDLFAHLVLRTQNPKRKWPGAKRQSVNNDTSISHYWWIWFS